MKFRVTWHRAAQRQLASLWNDATDHNAVSEASAWIDQALARMPMQLGESRTGNERLLIVPPMQALYSVDEFDRRVFVLSIGSSQRPR